MSELSLHQMEVVSGSDFWDGFCTVGTVVAIASGGSIPVANIIAAGCFLFND